MIVCREFDDRIWKALLFVVIKEMIEMLFNRNRTGVIVKKTRKHY